MLVLDDESQCRIELLGATQACGRPADTVVEHLALVDTERLEEFALVGEPAVERRAGYARLQRHLGEAELRLPASAKHFSGRDEDPVPCRGVLGVLGCVPSGA